VNGFPFLKLWYELNLCKIFQILIIKIMSKLSPARAGKLKFEIIFDVLVYLKGIQDVGVFVSTFSILIFLGQTVLVCQSYGSPWASPKRACTEKSRLNMI